MSQKRISFVPKRNPTSLSQELHIHLICSMRNSPRVDVTGQYGINIPEEWYCTVLDYAISTRALWHAKCASSCLRLGAGDHELPQTKSSAPGMLVDTASQKYSLTDPSVLLFRQNGSKRASPLNGCRRQFEHSVLPLKYTCGYYVCRSGFCEKRTHCGLSG